MPSADVTRRELSLGSPDSVTGWYAKSFAETTIKMVIRPRGQSVIGLPVGQYAKYGLTGFTVEVVEEGDEIIDAQGNYYEVKAVEEEWFLDSFSHRVCNLVKLPIHYDIPATYGAGLPEASQDARQRTKVFLGKHLLAANITKDNNTTQASYITCWANPSYPIQKVFVTKGVDLVFSVGIPSSQALRVRSRYEEVVPITTHSTDKTGITGTKLRWKGELELRRIVKDYSAGSFRALQKIEDNDEPLGSLILYSTMFTLNYRRTA